MNRDRGFAIWLTGLPASGKSTITRDLVEQLHVLGIFPAVLESDAVRKILTPEPVYSDRERDMFYERLALLGALLAGHTLPVIFDATANRQAYRERARALIPRYLEVFVDTPLDLCRARDPKGIYRSAEQARASSVPGVQAVYERPSRPDLVLDGRDDPAQNATRIIELARSAGII